MKETFKAVHVCSYRQITIQVCRIIEELYTQYVAKAASELASAGGDVIVSMRVHTLYPFVQVLAIMECSVFQPTSVD